ncbi:hypothetical protein [Asticcacaulis sp. AND118]|uniref:hypothetical protein n=1 Tax=Asticcacaulis sp. AND118 TaxID=2840468 RepID=UPI001CFFAD0F|nr:hypothetical protein [Asticcacaulis sp. AND118]UDF02950.1 hypothetical protein LH365_10975 [Asticcacaulis sp. AND118]
MTKYPVFAVLDDRSLSVFETFDNVRRDLEVIDIYAGEYSFYDALGRPLRPSVVPPEASIIGSLQLIGGGELKGFDIGNGAPLIERLSEVSCVNSNPHFPDISAITAHLTRHLL